MYGHRAPDIFVWVEGLLLNGWMGHGYDRTTDGRGARIPNHVIGKIEQCECDAVEGVEVLEEVIEHEA
jgi:hypothetical protein